MRRACGVLLMAAAGCAGSADMSWLEIRPAGGVEGALDPKLAAALAAAPAADYASMTLADVRASADQRFKATPKLGDKIDSSYDLKAGGVPVRVYDPEGSGPVPILLYFHGGGWVVGNLESHDDLCRSLCRRAGVLVVAVDYRLAPEARYPAGLQDAATVLRWLATNAASIGGDPKRIAVGGDSAGGNLAAALALRTRDRGGPAIAFQLLIYPVTVRDFDTPSYRRYAAGYGLTRDNMRWFWDQYLEKPADADDPYAAPLHAADLSGLPPAFVATAEFDVLRDEGEAYAAKLAEAGGRVKCARYLGMNHGFARMGALFPRAAQALDEMAAALKAGLSR
ncbi:MAG TPA: alpha/beta hydrolase [Planctomycetota bacterium]